MPEEDFFGDAQPVDYEWDLLDFSADRLLLQLNLTNPQEVSIDGAEGQVTQATCHKVETTAKRQTRIVAHVKAGW